MLPVMQIAALPAWLLAAAFLAAIPTSPSATLFENDQVKVVRAFEKNQVVGKFHQHEQDRIMVYLQPGRQHFEYQDGRPPETLDWKAGQVVWSPADGMHSPQALDHDFNIIEIELKKPDARKPASSGSSHPRLDPLQVDPHHYHLEFENSRVRVLRVNIGPHGVAPMHAHTLNRVTVFLTDQNFRTTDTKGTVATVEHKAREIAWGTPSEHAERNLSAEPFEAVTIELK